MSQQAKVILAAALLMAAECIETGNWPEPMKKRNPPSKSKWLAKKQKKQQKRKNQKRR